MKKDRVLSGKRNVGILNSATTSPYLVVLE